MDTNAVAAAPDPVLVTTSTTIYSWNNIPIDMALFFALAGTFFVGIYFLRRSKKI
jgi:hypothetical protein